MRPARGNGCCGWSCIRLADAGWLVMFGEADGFGAVFGGASDKPGGKTLLDYATLGAIINVLKVILQSLTVLYTILLNERKESI